MNDLVTNPPLLLSSSVLLCAWVLPVMCASGLWILWRSQSVSAPRHSRLVSINIDQIAFQTHELIVVSVPKWCVTQRATCAEPFIRAFLDIKSTTLIKQHIPASADLTRAAQQMPCQ